MIDARIPLQVEPPPDPLQRMGQIMGLRQQRRVGQREEARFAAEQREQQEQDAVRAVIQKHGGFTEEAIQEIATIHPEAALGLQQLIQQGQITALNLKKAQQPEPPPEPRPEWIETEGPEGEAGRLYDVPEPGRFYRKPVPPDKPPAEPTTFDADILAAKRSGDAQRLKDALALKKQALEAGRAPPAAPELTPNARLEATLKLRDRFVRETQAAQLVQTQYEQMQSAIEAVKQGAAAAGSQGVLVTFQKILDPTSVVRESEYARSSAGLSLLGRMEGQ